MTKLGKEVDPIHSVVPMIPPPTISIVVPTRNRAELLRATLQSVERQSYRDWECIVVDDGSTDESLGFLRKLASQDPRFRFRETELSNRGANQARNIGWRDSHGRYVIFLDSDDLLAARCLEQRLATMERCPHLRWAAFYGQLFQHVPGDLDRIMHIGTAEDLLDRAVGMRLFFQSTGILWARAMLDEIGGWDETLPSWQDWDVQLRAMILFPDYAFFPQVDFYYRTSEQEGRIEGTKFRDKRHLKRFVELLDQVRILLAEKQMLTAPRAAYLGGDAFFAMQRFLFIGERRLAAWAWRWAGSNNLVTPRAFRVGQLFIRCYNRPIAGKLCYSLFFPLLEAQPGLRFTSLLGQVPRSAIDADEAVQRASRQLHAPQEKRGGASPEATARS